MYKGTKLDFSNNYIHNLKFNWILKGLMGYRFRLAYCDYFTFHLPTSPHSPHLTLLILLFILKTFNLGEKHFLQNNFLFLPNFMLYLIANLFTPLISFEVLVLIFLKNSLIYSFVSILFNFIFIYYKRNFLL